MTQLIFKAMATVEARSYQSGVLDANGQAPEQYISQGDGVPCRHCLQEVPAGELFLVLNYRPFPELQPYAESGPIFLCAKACERHPDSAVVPQMFQNWDELLIRGYDNQNRIIYGTGQVVPIQNIPQVAKALFDDKRVRYIHMRSSTNNCYQCRIDVK